MLQYLKMHREADKEMLVKQLTTPEELLEMDMITGISFVAVRDLEVQKQKRMAEAETPLPYDAWGVLDDGGNLGAAMVNHNFHVRFDGHDVPASGIGAVCSMPEFRSKGGIRAIFSRVLGELHAKGCVFSYLFPFSIPYYRQFGYELLHTSDRYEIAIEALQEFRCEYQASLCSTGGATEDMRSIYSRFIQKFNLPICREDQHWRDSQGDPFKDRCYKYTFYDQQKNPRAYIVFQPERKDTDSPRVIAVKDLAFLAPEDIPHILGFLYRLRAQYGKITLPMPENVPLFAMIPDSLCVKHTGSPQGQLRVVNVQSALEAMRCPADSGSAVIAVDDPFLKENTGTYLLTFAGGQAVSVEKRPDLEPDIRLSIQRFSQMVTGYLDLAQSEYVSDVEILKNRPVLEKLFVHKPIFFTDHF